jgi:hypothetical protein
MEFNSRPGKLYIRSEWQIIALRSTSENKADTELALHMASQSKLPFFYCAWSIMPAFLPSARHILPCHYILECIAPWLTAMSLHAPAI